MRQDGSAFRGRANRHPAEHQQHSDHKASELKAGTGRVLEKTGSVARKEGTALVPERHLFEKARHCFRARKAACQEGRHFAVYLVVHTKHSQKAVPLSVARLKMNLPIHNRLAYNRVLRRSARTDLLPGHKRQPAISCGLTWPAGIGSGSENDWK